MKGRLLVTGALGFTGRWLQKHVADDCLDWEFVGLDVCATPPAARAKNLVVDILDGSAMRDVMASVAPGIVIHLAGLMRAEPDAAVDETNIEGTLNVLRAAAMLPIASRPRILVVGSAAEYGNLLTEGDITEDCELRPSSRYGASKAAAELLSLAYARRGELPVIAARTFNVIGPGQPRGFLCADVVEQLCRSRHNERGPVVRVGNLNPVRDFVDIRDVVRAYLLLALRGKPGQAYNVGSGFGRSVREVVESLIRLSGETAMVQSETCLRRPADADRVVADTRRIRADVGWQAEIDLTTALRDMLEAAKTHSEEQRDGPRD